MITFYWNILITPNHMNWKNMKVPEVLLSGNHKKISDWRLKKSIEKTKKIRPDLRIIFKRRRGSMNILRKL